jgi:glutamine synthetase
MQHSAAVQAALGREFVMVYCENKRQDHLAFLHAISPREYQWYL